MQREGKGEKEAESWLWGSAGCGRWCGGGGGGPRGIWGLCVERGGVVSRVCFFFFYFCIVMWCFGEWGCLERWEKRERGKGKGREKRVW